MEEKFNIKIYEGQEITELTKKFLEKDEKGIIIGPTDVYTDMDAIIDPKYKEQRDKLIKYIDSSKASIRIGENGIYIGIIHKNNPIIIGIEGDLEGVLKKLS